VDTGSSGGDSRSAEEESAETTTEGGEEKKWKEKEGMRWIREVLDKIETVV
jgi:hypothetical protein